MSANVVCRDDPRRNTELTNEQIKEFIMTGLVGKKKRRALKWVEKRIEKGISGADAEDDDDEEEAAEDKGDKFKIILRSKAAKDITLTVRPTTKCGAIVKAFLKSAGLADKYPGAGEVAGKTPAKKGRKTAAPAGGPWLAVDGDKMANNVEIGEADLEDGDMVEVTGL